MPEINRGDYCIIANNMGSAFMAGDRVLVEDISPDPSRPAYKYVVLSVPSIKKKGITPCPPRIPQRPGGITLP